MRYYFWPLGLFLVLFASAQSPKKEREITIIGNVSDEITKAGIGNCLVSLLKNDTTFVDSTRVMMLAKENGRKDAVFFFNIPAKPEKYLLKFEAGEYVTCIRTFNIQNVARNTRIEIPLTLLRRKEKIVELGEVIVKASKIKMIHRGDTIVYNADAFSLAEGSMLDALIKQLPGVELRQNGEITVNGKRIETLFLNGKNFFHGKRNVLLENLPNYTVKEIRAYESISSFSEKGKEAKQMIMDVRLKPEFSIGYIGNLFAGSNIEKLYESKTFFIRFSDFSRIGLYGNINNVNHDTPFLKDNELNATSVLEGRMKSKSIGIDILLNDRYNEWEESFNLNVNWREKNTQTLSFLEFFLSGANNYSYSSNDNKNKVSEIKAENIFQIKKKYNLKLDTKIVYEQSKNRDNVISGSTNKMIANSIKAAIDSLLRDGREADAVLNNNIEYSLRDMKQLGVDLNGSYFSKFQSGDDINVELNFTYNSNRPESRDIRQINYFTSFEKKETDRYSHSPQYYMQSSLLSQYNMHFFNGNNLSFEYMLSYQKKHSVNDTYLFNMEDMQYELPFYGISDNFPFLLENYLDGNNSYKYDQDGMEHRAAIRDVYEKSKNDNFFRMEIYLPLAYVYRTMDYRSVINPAQIKRNNMYFEPTISFYKSLDNGKRTYNARYSFSSQKVSLFDVLDRTDSQNELLIRRGNTSLKDAYVHLFQFTTTKSLKNYGFLSSSLYTMFNRNQTVQERIFDTQNGKYTLTPKNVNGNWVIAVYNTVNYPFGKQRNWNIANSFINKYAHLKDCSSTESQTQLATIHKYSLHDNVKVDFNWKNLNASLKNMFVWDYIYGKRLLNKRISTFSIVSNFHMLYNIERYHLCLSTDFQNINRFGNVMENISKNSLLWNISVSKSFLKGKINMGIDFFDILNQNTNKNIIITDQYRKEIETDCMSRYAIFKIIYHLHSKKKK